LGCQGDWTEFCLRGILHGGDNDSTGTIGGCWFGALYGLKNIPETHMKDLEKYKELVQMGEELYKIARKEE